MPPRRTTKSKYKRADGAPKRFKSAFMSFSERRHKEIREQSQDKKILASDVAKVVSKEWRSLAPEEKVQWENMASHDRDRYYREKAAYKGPWKVLNVKDPTAPRKPMSAFLAFSNERREAISDANPSMGNSEISGVLSAMWKAAPDEVRNKYRDQEAQERAKFKLTMIEWKQKQIPMLSKSQSGDDDTKATPRDDESEGEQTDLAQQAHPSVASRRQVRRTHKTIAIHLATFQQLPSDDFQYASMSSPFRRLASHTSSVDMHASSLAPFQTQMSQQQQHLTLPPVPPVTVASQSPSTAFKASMTNPFVQAAASSSSAQLPRKVAQQPEPPQVQATDQEYQFLEPFIDTDIGGFLAAFAALEQQSEKYHQTKK